jgi:hypothetical protein
LTTRAARAGLKQETRVSAHGSFSGPWNEETGRNSAGFHKNEEDFSVSLTQEPDTWPSDSVASPPREKNEDRNQSCGDQHPVLAFKTQKYKTLDEKLHRSRPQFLGRISGLFVQDKYFDDANISF